MTLLTGEGATSPLGLEMTPDDLYPCEHCDETFETPAAKASHVAQRTTRIHPVEKLIAIRELATELGRVPTIEEMNDCGSVSADTIEREFGSWNDGIRAAGLDPINHRNLDRDQLLAAIRELAETLGHAPRIATWVDRGRHGIDAVYNQFESWEAAVEAAGYTPVAGTVVHGYIDRESVCDAIRDIAADLGRAPAASEFNDFAPMSTDVVQQRFETYKAAVRAAGLEPYDPRSYYSETVLESIRELGAELGRPPTAQEMDTDGTCIAKTVARHFGSWNAGLRAAGFEVHLQSGIHSDDLLAAIHDLHEQIGRVPTWMDNRRHGRHSVTTYHERFGNWDAALEAAGLEPPDPPSVDPETPVRYYGPERAAQRRRVLARDRYTCRTPGCTTSRVDHYDQFDCDLCVHHVRPLRSFVTDGTVDYERANRLSNLVTVCLEHHGLWERFSPLAPDIR